MSITIPAGGSFQNSSKPWLSPQVLVDISLDAFSVIASPTFDQTTLGLGVLRYDRVINAQIQLIYIDENKVAIQLEKVLGTVADALISDWNPAAREGIALQVDTPAINPINFQFGLQIDSSQEIRYVSVWIQSQKLKVEYATQAFERVKTYVLAALQH